MNDIVTTKTLYQHISAYTASVNATSIGSVVDGMSVELVAEVVDVDDDALQCRVKAHINGLTRTDDNEIAVDDLPWCYAAPMMLNMYDVPAVGDYVLIDMTAGIYNAKWHHIDCRSSYATDIIGDEIADAKIIFLEDASRFNSEGTIGIWWTPNQGFMWQFNEQVVNMRADGTVAITDGKKWLHLTANDKISIGSETTSAEPAVLGIQNEDALNQLNDAIKELSSKLNTVMTQLSTLSKANPYTASLSPGFDMYATSVDTPVNTTHSSISQHIPNTKSQVVTLD